MEGNGAAPVTIYAAASTMPVFSGFGARERIFVGRGALRAGFVHLSDIASYGGMSAPGRS